MHRYEPKLFGRDRVVAVPRSAASARCGGVVAVPRSDAGAVRDFVISIVAISIE
jgi:hypothetical protein